MLHGVVRISLGYETENTGYHISGSTVDELTKYVLSQSDEPSSQLKCWCEVSKKGHHHSLPRLKECDI